VPQTGEWTYAIKTVKNVSQSDVIVNVQSKSRTEDGDVVQISSWMSYLPENNTIKFDVRQKITVFAEVVRGRAPVLNADVLAIIERPQAAPLKIPLYDNGMGML
jgi:hypothetical protein